MKDVPNLSTVIEQINGAALRATTCMRALGVLLSDSANDVPLLDEVDRHLRELTCEAYLSFLATRDEARSASPHPFDFEIEGEATDDTHFDVYVSGLAGAPQGFLTVQILQRLV